MDSLWAKIIFLELRISRLVQASQLSAGLFFMPTAHTAISVAVSLWFPIDKNVDSYRYWIFGYKHARTQGALNTISTFAVRRRVGAHHRVGINYTHSNSTIRISLGPLSLVALVLEILISNPSF